MGRLIDADTLKVKMIKYGFHAIDMTVTEFVEDMLPTVEAIPKAEYEARLKADMVAILDRIRAEIAEYGSICVEYKLTLTDRRDKDIEQLVSDVLKQAKKQVLDVIDKYRGERGDNNGM